MATSTADIEIRFLGETSDLREAGEEASEVLEDVREKTEEVSEAGEDMAGSMAVSSRGLSGLATITRQINPQIGALATGLVAGHRAAKGFGTSLVAVSRWLGPIAAAAGAAYLAIRTLGTESRTAAESADRLADSQLRLNQVLKSVQMTSLQASLSMGEITTAEFEMQSAAIATGEIFSETRAQLKNDIDILAGEIAEISNATPTFAAGPLSFFGMLQSGYQDFQRDAKLPTLIAELEEMDAQLVDLDNAAATHQENLLIIAQDSITAGEATGALNDALAELVKTQREYNDSLKDQKTWLADAKELREGGSKELEKEARGLKGAKGLMDDGVKSARDMENNQGDIITGFGEMINAAQMFNDELSADANAQFFRQQSLAMAEVAFRTGVNIVESGGNPWLLAGAIALGAAQSAAIAAQSPPSAHMGLIQGSQPLAPDETMTKVLTGEAILDRAAVNRLGGEQGVRALNRGEGIGGRVAVVVPWKHLDRELGRSARSDTRFSRAMRRSGSVTNGQRGW